ncbi:hypothetical protein H109_06061 [Trichophyton interdigitale MR816]|uniref:Uncharacterized protein n=1 Tax=Trichophyton interdigitale (strain MR816) TaxID=1215338 RepID=A0A059J299_TRIIM|nr:hypothetical protein H109_06061 [Trichophyton interdigitale MR816]
MTALNDLLQAPPQAGDAMETANHSGKPMRKNKPSQQEEEMRETPPQALKCQTPHLIPGIRACSSTEHLLLGLASKVSGSESPDAVLVGLPEAPGGPTSLVRPPLAGEFRLDWTAPASPAAGSLRHPKEIIQEEPVGPGGNPSPSRGGRKACQES